MHKEKEGLIAGALCGRGGDYFIRDPIAHLNRLQALCSI
jgi:hypothetical protein